MYSPKRWVETHLATTRVTQTYIDMHACTIWFDLMKQYAPDIVVQMYYPEQFANPVVTSRFPGIPLRTALEDICRYCKVEMSVSDRGTIVLRQPRKVAAMRQAVVIEPDPREWVKIEVKYVS